MKKLRKFGLASLLLLMVLSLVGCASLTGAKTSGTITVVGKNFTEQDIMANLVGLMLQKNTDLNVNIKSFLGGTDVCFNAVKNGSADLYVEYTGTGLVDILGQKPMTDPQKVAAAVKTEFPQKYKLEWLNPIGFNDTYAIAVTKETAEKYHLSKISDLSKYAGSLTFGAEQEFLGRSDGLPGLEKDYGFKFNNVKAMDTGLKYEAIANNKVDVIDAFATDGQLIKYHLVLLQDDKHFFPPYYAAPLVRMATLKKYPQIKTVLDKLTGKINDQQMAELNAQVAVDKKPAKDVAMAWLQKEGLIKK